MNIASVGIAICGQIREARQRLQRLSRAMDVGCSTIGLTHIDISVTAGQFFALLANQRLPHAEYLLDNSQCFRD
ncbi:hypothetical protein AC630_24660 [Bradyrhizobium sp. AS23.2]|nr:hypothetical protein AC630_24660 [Bradyrhizobium sp. AS23.2]